MCCRQCLVHTLAALLYFLAQVYGDASSCIVELVVQRQIPQIFPGSSLQIHCIVTYCPGRKPHVFWCKLHGSHCFALPEEPGRITYSWREEPTATHPGDFVLRFVSIQLNDTGAYRCCSETWDRRTSVSPSVHVNVSDGYTTESPNHTSTTQEFSPTTKNMRKYLFAALGTLCLTVIGIFCLCCIIRKIRRGNPKTSDDGLHARTNRDIGSLPPRSSSVFTSTVNVLYSSNCGSTIGLPQDQPTETVYENDRLPPMSTNSTESTTANHNSACNSNKALPADDGVVAYAALNHSSTKKRFYQELCGVQAELREYAVICERTSQSQA